MPRTTFWMDFSIADCVGTEAVKETYERIFNEFNTNAEYLTELVIVLKWKIWDWYEKNGPLAEIYNELYEKADQFALATLDDELAYFLKTVD